MRVGDTVKLHDGSYNMTLLKGILEHNCGIALQEKRRYRVLSVSGMYPTEESNVRSGNNDIMLVDVKDPDFVLFTQERFCYVVTSASPLAAVKHEVTIPRGVKEVHLTLQ